MFSGFSYILSDIQCHSLPGSDDFVLFYLLDGNGALFAYVLCDIPVLHISLIWIGLVGNIAIAIYERNQLNLYVGVCVK